MTAITVAPKPTGMHVIAAVAGVTRLGLFYGIFCRSRMASVTSQVIVGSVEHEAGFFVMIKDP